MQTGDIIDILEAAAPPALQESYDNAGLITGSRNSPCSGVMLCLDATEEVIDEAIAKKCNLVVAHHPILFSGLKRLNGSNYIERALIKAIRHDIAIYAAHTNLDNVLQHGVNEKIASRLGLINTRILQPKKGLLKKLVTFCPDAYADMVRQALFAAGAGQIGNYDSCSYNVQGEGTFRGGENTNPFVGKKGELHAENETRIETIFEQHKEKRLLQALFKAHPYEEVAYDIYPLDNAHPRIGAGLVGELPAPVPVKDFLAHLQEKMNLSCIRYTHTAREQVSRVALCGGSGSFLVPQARTAGADVLVTADFKYHQFFDGEKDLMIADIGHYESEIYTLEIFHSLITEKFDTFAVLFTSTNTNPVNYYTR